MCHVIVFLGITGMFLALDNATHIIPGTDHLSSKEVSDPQLVHLTGWEVVPPKVDSGRCMPDLQVSISATVLNVEH